MGVVSINFILVQSQVGPAEVAPTNTVCVCVWVSWMIMREGMATWRGPQTRDKRWLRPVTAHFISSACMFAFLWGELAEEHVIKRRASIPIGWVTPKSTCLPRPHPWAPDSLWHLGLDVQK